MTSKGRENLGLPGERSPRSQRRPQVGDRLRDGGLGDPGPCSCCSCQADEVGEAHRLRAPGYTSMWKRSLAGTHVSRSASLRCLVQVAYL